jgi:hypothetical protein
MANDDGNVESTFLMILGRDLDPDTVSRKLKLVARRSWRRGDRKIIGDSRHKYGGWQRVVPDSVGHRPLVTQLAYWARLLGPRKRELREMSRAGYQCILDIFVLAEEGAVALIEPKLLRAVASLGLELHVSFEVYDRETRRKAAKRAS